MFLHPLLIEDCNVSYVKIFVGHGHPQNNSLDPLLSLINKKISFPSLIQDLLTQSQNLRDSLMYESSMMTNNLLILALGLHIAELLDMLIFSKITLLTVHHMVFIACALGALFFEKAVGFGVLSLVNLLNTVSIKTRFQSCYEDSL